MKYGCIGEHLKHSFSKEIHAALSNYEYEIREVARDELCKFMSERDFLGINVTIPYKELVIPHLHYIAPVAQSIGAVNTIVKRDGKLYGYNTDFYGMGALIGHAGVSIKGKSVAILGTGGTSKTAASVVQSMGAGDILRVSRSAREGAISYTELYEQHSDVDVIINTTPAGMFPNIFDKPVDISRFPAISGVIDAVYNPLRTPLVSEAMRRGIAAEGGLYMLVAQAVRASEIFFDTKYPDGETERIFKKILNSKENIVLIGMPASGKSTVGKLLAERLGRRFIDTDDMIEMRAKMKIPQIFQKHGEAHFRRLEFEAVREAAAESSAVIATGGGAVLREDNVEALRENGRLYFIDRPLKNLVPTADRPLSSTRAAIEKRYTERYPLYLSVCDARIDANATPREVCEKISEDFKS